MKEFQQFQSHMHSPVLEKDLSSIVECSQESISFNQNEDELLKLGDEYECEFTVTNVSREQMKLEFFASGFKEPHHFVFDPSATLIEKGDSKRVKVTALFRCTAELLPTTAKVCCAFNKKGEWGKLCGIEAHTDITKFLSYDNIEKQQKPIGEGTYGTVYSGKYKGTPVAIKVYKTFREDNNAEAHLFETFNSPYIVRFYGVCYSMNALVLEYCKFGSVEHCYNNQEMTDEVKVLICYDFARAIKYLHDNSHIHRDLKPDNLLMSSFSHDPNIPRAKLSDFGTGKVSFKQEKNGDVQRTPAFIAPEVLSGIFDKKCDVYSFGMSMWSIFAEKQPYEDEALCNCRSEQEYYQMICQGVRPTLVPECPLNALIVKCWDTAQDNRPDFTEIAEETERIIGITKETPNETQRQENSGQNKEETQNETAMKDLSKTKEEYVITESTDKTEQLPNASNDGCDVSLSKAKL